VCRGVDSVKQISPGLIVDYVAVFDGVEAQVTLRSSDTQSCTYTRKSQRLNAQFPGQPID